MTFFLVRTSCAYKKKFAVIHEFMFIGEMAFKLATDCSTFRNFLFSNTVLFMATDCTNEGNHMWQDLIPKLQEEIRAFWYNKHL